MSKGVNKFKPINAIILKLNISLINPIQADDKIVYKSIYNIKHGALIYSNSSNGTYSNNYLNRRNNDRESSYLWGDYAHTFSGNWKQTPNWGILYQPDGTISFVNQYSGLCLQHYGRNYQIVEGPCTSNHKKQKVNFQLISTGAMLIKFAHNGECIYMYSGTSYYSIYSDVCDQTDKRFYWAIIPALIP